LRLSTSTFPSPPTPPPASGERGEIAPIRTEDAMTTASTRWRRFCLLLLAALGPAITAGCGGGPRRVPVSGNVTVDGVAVNGGVLHFYPDADKGNQHRAD